MLRRGEIETPFGASQRHALADEIRFFDIVNIHPQRGSQVRAQISDTPYLNCLVSADIRLSRRSCCLLFARGRSLWRHRPSG